MSSTHFVAGPGALSFGPAPHPYPTGRHRSAGTNRRHARNRKFISPRPILGLLAVWGATCGSSLAQEALTNGGRHPGTVAANGTNTYSLAATAGDRLVLRAGRVDGSSFFSPWLRIYGPDAGLVGTDDPGNNRVAEIELTATNSGTFTVLVSDGAYSGYTAAGTYELSYCKTPGSVTVSPGDEGGSLTNGALHAGFMSDGDLDVWSFTAAPGDNVVVRVGEVTASGFFNPWLRIYGPAGTLVGSADPGTYTAAEVALTATNAGTFTVVVADGGYGSFGGTGDYQLSMVQAPGPIAVSAGDHGGDLVNGALNQGTISEGDLDGWSFTANAGDSVVVRAGVVTAAGFFNPWLRVYGPDGALLGSADPGTLGASEVALRTTHSGTFTVVVADGGYSSLGGTGTYELSVVKSPGSFVVSAGDHGGALTNGALNTGIISEGDLDAWGFSANTGDTVIVRVGGVTASGFFNPWLRVYGPDGALLGSADPATYGAAEVALTATNSGGFTAVVADGGYGGYAGTGAYELSFVRAPGDLVVSPDDAGGTLTNGVLIETTINPGDLDVWTFAANAGEDLVLRFGWLTSTGFFNPWLRLYGPDGAELVSRDTGTGVAAEMVVTTTNSGLFTVVVSDGAYGSYAGTGIYGLTLVHPPALVSVSPGDEGGGMVNGVTYTGTNSIGDLEVWSFSGTPGDSNVFRVATTNCTPWLRLYDPAGALVAQAFTASMANRTNHLVYVVTNAGNYTLVSGSYYVTQAGTYALKQSRVPPDLKVPDPQFLDEADTLQVTISAQDPDEPDKALTFALISGPPGLTLTPAGNTNATLTWATTEADGPSTNVIAVSVTDVVNGRPFTRTNRFTVIVNELNEPPLLTVPGTQAIDERTPLNVFASADDVDLPANGLTYRLVAPPTGMTIHPSTGAITWTPTEAQGSNTYSITVVVTDDNPPAVNATALSTTNRFVVEVHEVNTPPQLTVPGAQTVTEQSSLNVAAAATDADFPTNLLTYALVSAPGGMTINPNTGAIAWTPTEAQGANDYTVVVSATDHNPAAVNTRQLSVTNSFSVTVYESNIPPRFTSMPASQMLMEEALLSVSVMAADDDLPANPLTYALVAPPSGMTVNAASGAINWTPTEAQGSNLYTITVTVADTNAAAINQTQFIVTNRFTVTVNESNRPPRFIAVPGDQTMTEETLLNLAVVAADDDLPANPLTYALVSPPPGMNINLASGEITWTPTEAQGSNLYTITVTVADTNATAINQQQWIVTNTFFVTVNESNRPPVLEAITNQSVYYGTSWSWQAVASDPDLPTNLLQFTLAQAPTGMVLNAGSGLLTWTPTQPQVGAHPVILRVADDGPPSLSATQTFVVTVTGEASRLTINPVGTLAQINMTGNVGLDYELQYSTNCVHWDRLLLFRLEASPYPYVDPASATAPQRFYRLKFVQ